MKRILFVAEDVTLSQVVRLVVLARALDPSRYQVHFACRYFDDLVFRAGEFHRWDLYTVSREAAHEALEKGKRIYDTATLRRYVRDDLRVIEAVQPDLIVSDFRLSMAISARVAGVPFAAVISGHWSPHAVRKEFPMPDHPIIRVVGERTASRYFPMAMPKAFAHFAEPVNTLRKEHGLAEIGSLLQVLTYSDHTLYPDVPHLTPMSRVPAGHRFIGPVPWAPTVPRPPWWARMQASRRPLVYATMGSSGRLDVLPRIVDAVAKLPVDLAVATAGRIPLERLPRNVYAAEYLPGQLLCERATAVVCNGGSSTGYQALAQGTPILGIAANLDQHLAIAAVEERGAGIRLRAQAVKVRAIRSAVDTLLSSVTHRRAARRVGAEFARWPAQERFREFVAEATAEPIGVQAAEPRRRASVSHALG